MIPFNIAVVGLGTVGTSVIHLIQQQQELLTQRCGRLLQIWAVSARDKNKQRGINMHGIEWVDDALQLVQQKDIDLVIELIGGTEYAKDIIETALKAGKPVVTANKALIAAHGIELANLAEQHGVGLAFEAAVAGGIPALKTLREGLSGNEIEKVSGILNGTCNYILTTMQKTGAAFSDVLAEAQQLGYAEADPTFDIDGIDTAHKLTILTAIAFGTKLRQEMSISGIRDLKIEDVRYAQRLGYTIKLLGIAQKIDNVISQTVYPAMILQETSLASVDNVLNAVEYQGNAVGKLVLTGPGAGGNATASAVIADICDIAGGRLDQPFGIPVSQLKDGHFTDTDHRYGAYYLRLTVADMAGVAGQITTTLGTYNISIDRLEQLSKQQAPAGNDSTILIITHPAQESDVKAALDTLTSARYMQASPVMIRVEDV